MSCNCRTEIEEKLLNHFKTNEPAATEHKVKLQGYAYCFGEKGTSVRAFMPYETFAQVPMRKGGAKPKKTTGNMFFSHCPFCGEKQA